MTPEEIVERFIVDLKILAGADPSNGSVYNTIQLLKDRLEKELSVCPNCLLPYCSCDDSVDYD